MPTNQGDRSYALCRRLTVTTFAVYLRKRVVYYEPEMAVRTLGEGAGHCGCVSGLPRLLLELLGVTSPSVEGAMQF